MTTELGCKHNPYRSGKEVKVTSTKYTTLAYTSESQGTERLGFDLSTTAGGANKNNHLSNWGGNDSAADQQAITNGYQYKVNTTEKSNKYESEQYRSRRTRWRKDE